MTGRSTARLAGTRLAGTRLAGSRLAGARVGVLGLALAAILSYPGPALADSPVVVEAAAGTATGSASVWNFDLYGNVPLRLQDPDWDACTAAATMSMLNLVANTTPETIPPRGDWPTTNLVWRTNDSYAMQREVLEFEREHMTMYYSSAGTDPHGWRNALNYYGWGSIYAGVYKDVSFGDFDTAVDAIVLAVARTHKPVGVPGWFGGHAQYVSGYIVSGQDPELGDNFTVEGVYLSDPLEGDWTHDRFTTYDVWRNGPSWIRFSQYWQADSPFVDPVDGQEGYSEWWGKWVTLLPVK